MASKIIKHDWNGHSISQKVDDGFVNLTDMCKAEGRRVGDYLDLPGTKAYITALADHLGLLPENLVLRKEGRGGSTSAHPDIAAKCKEWAGKRAVASDWLYVVEMVGHPFIKIGITNNMKKRLVHLQASNPIELRVLQLIKIKSGAKQIEARLHRALEDFHQSGEWFDSAALSIADWDSIV